MKEIYFIFDETNINNFIQMLWCAIVEDDSFFDLLIKYQKNAYLKPQFWNLKNSFPHYTEDWHNQRTIILEEYRMLPYKSYFYIDEYKNQRSNFKEIYEQSLNNLIKPQIIKYIKKYWKKNIKLIFLFENLSSETNLFFENIIDKWIHWIEKEIKMISKSDYNWATSLIDYNCWILSEYLKDANNEKPNSYWRSVYNSIVSKIWLIIYKTEEKTDFYHFKTQRSSFETKYHWKFAKVS